MANLVRSSKGISPWRDFFNADNFLDTNWLSKWERDYPAVNIAETDKSYLVEVVAPGFQKDDFKVKVDDNILTISAENKSETNENGKDREYTRREYSYNSFTRSFQLPDDVKDDSISANYKDGVLKLEMPKSKTQTKATKEIAIN